MRSRDEWHHLNGDMPHLAHFEQVLKLISHDVRSADHATERGLVDHRSKPRWIVAAQDLLPPDPGFDLCVDVVVIGHPDARQELACIRLRLQEPGRKCLLVRMDRLCPFFLLDEPSILRGHRLAAHHLPCTDEEAVGSQDLIAPFRELSLRRPLRSFHISDGSARIVELFRQLFLGQPSTVTRPRQLTTEKGGRGIRIMVCHGISRRCHKVADGVTLPGSSGVNV
jgi:hypothetical protein